MNPITVNGRSFTVNADATRVKVVCTDRTFAWDSERGEWYSVRTGTTVHEVLAVHLNAVRATVLGA